ncbi:MAG TPA: hypothetical protein VGK34_09600, partial [Armatimonadota bacterium]
MRLSKREKLRCMWIAAAFIVAVLAGVSSAIVFGVGQTFASAVAGSVLYVCIQYCIARMIGLGRAAACAVVIVYSVFLIHTAM